MPAFAVSEAQVWDALAAVPDPEIPVVSITDMGMVRAVRLQGGVAEVDFTPTFSGCPALEVIRRDIEVAVSGLGLRARVNTLLSPPWSTDLIEEDARERLRQYGIAPPAPAGEESLISLELTPTQCPRCGSFDVRMTAAFGATLCKRAFVCSACQEPFEGFKSV